MAAPFASALSKLARLSMNALDSADAAAATIPLSFTKFDPGCSREMINIGRQVGGMSNLGDDIKLTRTNITRVSPRSAHKPGTSELIELLGSIFNTTPAGTGVIGDPYIWEPAAAQRLRSRDLWYHDTQRIWDIQGACVSKATFSAQSAQEMTLNLEWEGVDYTNSGSYPTLDVTDMLTDRFLFTDASVVVGGITGVRTRSIRLMIDHDVENNRYFYGTTSAGPINRQRTYMLDLDVPYGIHNTIITVCAVDGGAAATATFINPVSGSTLVFTMPAIRSNSTSVPADVPDEMFGTLSATCFEDMENDVPGVWASLIV